MRSLLALAVALTIALAAVAPAYADEELRSGRVFCGGVHGPRAFVSGTPTQIIDTSYGFRNANLRSGADVRITRLTFRDFFGNIVDEFGDGAPSGSIPTNKDIPPTFSFDITTVPAGASYYLTTTHIYGNAFIPGPGGAGSNMSVVVEFTTTGNSDLFFVTGSLRTRQLLVGPTGLFQHEEHARTIITCTKMGR